MKSVLHVITTIERGGAENQLLILVTRQIQLGYSVDILFLKGKPELKEDFESIGAKVISDFSRMSFLAQIFRFRLYIENRYQIIHSHLPRAEILALTGLGKARLIGTKHNSEPFMPGSLSPISFALARTVFLLTDETICISNAVRSYLVNIHELPSSSMKISVILYGWPKLSLENSKGLKFPPYQLNDSIKIGTISRLSHQKDLPTLLNAFAGFLQKYPGSVLEIVGAGPEESKLRSLAASLGIINNVHFLGRLDDVFAKLRDWNIFVLTSKYEGFGMVLLEAMQMKRPIIAANNSSIPEVLGDDYPWLFSTGDVQGLIGQLIKVCVNEIEFNFEEFSESRIYRFDDIEMANAVNRIYFGKNAH